MTELQLQNKLAVSVSELLCRGGDSVNSECQPPLFQMLGTEALHILSGLFSTHTPHYHPGSMRSLMHQKLEIW